MPATASHVETVLATLEVFAATNSRAVRGDAAHHRTRAVPSSPFIKRFDPEADAEPLTWFHSETVPPFTLSRIMLTMRHRAWAIDEMTSLQAAALMLRFSDATGLPLTTLMLHRMFLVSLLLIAKVHHDVVPRNSDFARAAGLTIVELNRMELTLAQGVEWRTVISDVDVAAAVARLCAVPADVCFTLCGFESPAALASQGVGSPADFKAATPGDTLYAGDDDSDANFDDVANDSDCSMLPEAAST